VKAIPDPIPILRTKLLVPRPAGDLVSRGRLFELMDRGLDVPLTLVSAPAGYGKSVLVGEWCGRQEHPCAWVSLDEADSDLRFFLAYLVAAVDTIHPDVCRTTKELLTAPELPSASDLARELTNDLGEIDTPCLIVLDDLHRVVRSSPVYELLGRVLEYPPRNVHLVLLTRCDPPLALTSARARNTMCEVRLQDLRFTDDETAELLSLTRGLSVEKEALSNVQRELEGWPAGLRLVSLALGAADNPTSFLENLHGGLPQTQEYLFHEVLRALPPELRGFLLRASILDSFCPAALEAVCGPISEQASPALTGREFIAALQERNLFTIPLGAEGEWFRYHHLFRGLLRDRLREQQTPSELGSLHARASAWFEKEGLIEQAIGHALASGQTVCAAEILVRRCASELDEDRWYVADKWLARLPDELKQQHVELVLAQAWVDWFRFDLDRIPWVIERVEELLGEREADSDHLAELDYFRAVDLYWQGKGEECRQVCERALARRPRMRSLLRAEFTTYLSLAVQMAGQGAARLDALRTEIRMLPPNEHVIATRQHAAKAYLHLLSGELAPAASEANRVVAVAESWGSLYAVQWGRFLRALARFHAHRLQDARQSFLAVAERKTLFERRAAVDALGGLLLTYQLSGQPDIAMAVAEEQLAFARDQLRDLSCTALAESSRARLALLQGDLELAVDWANSIDAEMPAHQMFLWLENPPITRVRCWIAEGTEASVQAAIDSLDALRTELAALHLTCQTIEVEVLRALALEVLGRADPALRAAEEALELARPGGWIRPFVEAGSPMAGLLTRLGSANGEDAFVHKVLTALGDEHTVEPTPTGRGGRPASTFADSSYHELTNRELDVLELLAQRLHNKEIAARLFISDETVSYHLKHIYQKLHVHGRRQAVTKALEMGILPLA